MKKIVSFLLAIVCMFSFSYLDANATTSDTFVPYVIDFTLASEFDNSVVEESTVRATGLIYSYSLNLSHSGTTLYITGLTNCTVDVVKCGFKNLTVERRKSSSYNWEDYYEYGNVYRDATGASLNTSLVVASGYQYRVSCKHYAKKSLLVTQTISNTSGIVTVS